MMLSNKLLFRHLNKVKCCVVLLFCLVATGPLSKTLLAYGGGTHASWKKNSGQTGKYYFWDSQ